MAKKKQGRALFTENMSHPEEHTPPRSTRIFMPTTGISAGNRDHFSAITTKLRNSPLIMQTDISDGSLQIATPSSPAPGDATPAIQIGSPRSAKIIGQPKKQPQKRLAYANNYDCNGVRTVEVIEI